VDRGPRVEVVPSIQGLVPSFVGVLRDQGRFRFRSERFFLLSEASFATPPPLFATGLTERLFGAKKAVSTMSFVATEATFLRPIERILLRPEGLFPRSEGIVLRALGSFLRSPRIVGRVSGLFLPSEGNVARPSRLFLRSSKSLLRLRRDFRTVGDDCGSILEGRREEAGARGSFVGEGGKRVGEERKRSEKGRSFLGFRFQS
jgi:hypothetical protein